MYWANGNETSKLITWAARWHDVETYFTDTWRIKPRLTLDYGVRMSYLPPSYDANSLMANFVPSLYQSTKATAKDKNLTGLIYPTDLKMSQYAIAGGNANLKGFDVDPRALRNTSWHNGFAPRIGIAFDPKGDGKWAIRMGGGYFYGRSDVASIGNLSGNPPFSASLSWGNGRPFDSLAGLTAPTVGFGAPTKGMDLNWQLQGSYQWNLTVEHEIMKDTKLEVAYVATRGHHLPYNYNMNTVAPKDRENWIKVAHTRGSSADAASALYKALYDLSGTAAMTYITEGANSNYQSLQVYLNKRFSNNFSYQFAYTFSKLISQTGLGCCSGDSGAVGLVDIYNPGYNRGIGAFDRTHIASFNMIYKFPTLANYTKPVRFLAGGWEATGIYQFSSGIPLQVSGPSAISDAISPGNQSMRADMIAGVSPTANLKPGQFINPDAFSPVISGLAYGNSPRGVVRAPAINNADIAIYKNFKVGEGKQIQLRVETFNTFNHVQLYNIDTGYTTNQLHFDMKTFKYGPGYDLQDNGTLLWSPGCLNSRVANGGDPAAAGFKDPFPNCNNNTHFGYANSARDPREIQFALKFIF